MVLWMDGWMCEWCGTRGKHQYTAASWSECAPQTVYVLSVLRCQKKNISVFQICFIPFLCAVWPTLKIEQFSLHASRVFLWHFHWINSEVLMFAQWSGERAQETESRITTKMNFIFSICFVGFFFIYYSFFIGSVSRNSLKVYEF